MRRLCAAAIVMTALWIGLVGCGQRSYCPAPATALPDALCPDGDYYTYTIAYNEDGRATLQRVPYRAVRVPSPPAPEAGVVVPRAAPRPSRSVICRRACCVPCPPGTVPVQTAQATPRAPVPVVQSRIPAESIQSRFGTRAALDAQRGRERQATTTSAPRSQVARQKGIEPRVEVVPERPETLCQRALRLGAAETAQRIHTGRSSADYIIVNDPSTPIRRGDLPPAVEADDTATPESGRPARVTRVVVDDPFAIPEHGVDVEEDLRLLDDMPPPIRETEDTPSGMDVPPSRTEDASESAQVDAEPPALRKPPLVVPAGASTKLIDTDPLPEYIPNGDIAAPGSAYQGAYVGNLTYIQNAEAGTYKGGVLTLQRVAPNTAFFGGAKGHTSGSVSTNAFIRDWTSGRMPHGTRAPRALVSILTETGEILARVELSAPRADGRGLQYDARLVQGSIPETFGDVSLMIEPLE